MTGAIDKVIPDAARDLFRKAALDDVPQLVGILRDGRGGYCAMGYIEANDRAFAVRLITRSVANCHLCGLTKMTTVAGPVNSVWNLLVHLNNDHRLGWLDLAKVPEPGEEETM